MKRTLGNDALQTVAFILTTVLYLFCLCTSAVAMTKKDLIAFRDDVNNIVGESMLQLEPGTLKKVPLSQEQQQKRTMELIKIMGGTNDTNWHDTLSYYSDVFRKCAERLSKEVEIHDPELVDWNRKLIAGYQDSHEVTELALSLLRTPDMAGINQALTNSGLTKRIRDNQTYHHNIQAELDKIIKKYFPTDREVQKLSQELTGLFVETTWK